MGVNRLTQAEILARFKAAHGERYDYSRVHYRGMYRKVTIGCPVHGWFIQDPGCHARGSGCQECHYDKIYPQRVRRELKPDPAELAEIHRKRK